MANRALDGAERKGREARDRGDPRHACPYNDYRKDCGRLTFSRAFRNAWLHGWEGRDRELAHARFGTERGGRLSAPDEGATAGQPRAKGGG
ncbi:Rmf/CrpP family protein [Halomonas sp. GXIMD04776]|uniref:Rmf/CrpP family protein n=1 Tax=Halomonas sp. GXIMD04776 TaxID=3415605 RepID=UPI003C7EDE93